MITVPSVLRGLAVLALASGAAGSPGEPPSPPRVEADAGAALAGLEQRFRDPPPDDRPWAYWWWLKGNVTEASIRRDLEAMRRVGFAGFLLFDARGYHEGHVPPPESRMDFLSPEWRRLLVYSLKEAHRLGLRASVNLSSCAGALRGPWDMGDDAPKKIVWASKEVRGPARIRCELPRAEWRKPWEVAVVAARRGEGSAGEDRKDPIAAEVVVLSDRIDDRGWLDWDAPEGEWTIFRFACVILEGHESDADILSAKAIDEHFDRMGKAILEAAGSLAGETLTHFYSVSWEGAAPTWTLGFEEAFARRRGYDPRPFLPAIAGTVVKDRETSERFLRDYHKTLGDCFMDNTYGKLRARCREAGLAWHSESGGPWNRKLPDFHHADQLAFLGRNDIPQGEFWHLGRAFNRPAAMAAHIYGRPFAAAEAFTHMAPHWSAYPAALKRDADAAFCDGINFFIWHTFTASPPEFGKPGIEYFAGTHINPNVTWFEAAGDFVDYLARCQVLLRAGDFVADVCAYTGDRPYLHWGRGERWGADPSLILGPGYAYDLIDSEVLLERLAVKDGHLALPGGMRYRALAIDLEDETADPPVLRKVIALARAGATVVLGRRRPTRAPGLRDAPACDGEVRRLAAELWGSPEDDPRRRAMDRGEVFCGTAIDDVLREKGIARDVEAPWTYIHRRAGGLDIYFLSGSGEADCVFRAGGREPELWDPSTGRIRDAVRYRVRDDGRTVVPLRLPEGGSIFVVFGRPARDRHALSLSGPPEGLEIAGRTGEGVRLRLWKGGRYTLASSAGREASIEIVDPPDPSILSGPWEVRFAPGWSAPESIVFERLIPWNEHADEGIRYFSGTATYRCAFDLDGERANRLVRLALGRVRHIAEVRVNGRPAGIVWTAPWTADLTGLVRAGRNELEIDVTNLWVNRLIGDAGLPEEKRRTKTNVRLHPDIGGRANFKGYPPGAPLDPSGLLGPVRLEFGEERDVRL
ncbi:MAG: hypothetical protein JXP34_09480 [Planctomycetes bacterium]|nr:hypothetical protein [Planctomycetota bacterium]